MPPVFLLAIACMVTVLMMHSAWPQQSAKAQAGRIRQTNCVTAIAFGLLRSDNSIPYCTYSVTVESGNLPCHRGQPCDQPLLLCNPVVLGTQHTFLASQKDSFHNTVTP